MRPAVFLLAAVFATSANAQDKKNPPKAEAVLEFTGRLEGTVVEIRPRVTGYLTAIKVKDGEAVKKGQLLAEIDPRPYQAELDGAKARLVAAEAQVKANAATVARLKEAVKRGIVAKEDLDRADAELAVAEATVEAGKAEATRAGLNLAYTKLTAPIDGRVGRFLTSEGNLLTADTTHVVTVVQTDPLSVVFEIDERAFLKLRRDELADAGKMTARFRLIDEEGFPHTAPVNFIDPQVDPKTGTVRVRATLPNPKGLMSPGMFAVVRLTAAK